MTSVAGNPPPERRSVEGLYCTLPIELLNVLEPLLTPEQIYSESSQSAVADDHTQRVGTWNGKAILYGLLRRSELRRLNINEALIQELGWEGTPAQIRRKLAIGDERSKRMHEIAKGFAGWLMATPAFLTEHEELLDRYREETSEHGLPSIAMVSNQSLDGNAPGSPLSEFVADLHRFLLRWRLSALAAPNLPVPLQPMVPAAPILMQGPLSQVGRVFYFPDTFPIPSRDLLREVLDDALRADPQEHLREWTALIARDNAAKKTINRFGRLFELQHYCRVLHEQHCAALTRNVGRLKAAFAQYFEVTPETIHADFGFLRRRLCDRWLL